MYEAVLPAQVLTSSDFLVSGSWAYVCSGDLSACDYFTKGGGSSHAGIPVFLHREQGAVVTGARNCMLLELYHCPVNLPVALFLFETAAASPWLQWLTSAPLRLQRDHLQS